MNITESEVLEALRLAAFGEQPEADPNSATVAECAVAWGVGICTARRKLEALVAANRAEVVTKQISTADGRMLRVRAYRMAA